MSSFKVTSKTFPDFDFSQLKLNGVKPGKSGMKFANLQYKGQRIVVETPAMNVPWATEIRRMDESATPSCKHTLSFNGMDLSSDDKMSRFHTFLTKFDERIRELALEHKSELWSKNVDAIKIEGFHKSSVKESNDEKYAPTFQPKVKIDDGDGSGDTDKMNMQVSVYNVKKERLETSDLTGGSVSSAIVDASYLWVTPMMLGVTWTVKSILVNPKKKEEEFMFGEDAMEDFQVEGSTTAENGSVDGSENSKRKRSVDDSGSDDLENEEEEFEEEN